jgi:UDP-N-acetylglucosamine 2-epimerase (non-hydrolysing)
MIYVESGKNLLLGTNKQKIIDIVFDLLDNEKKLLDMKQIQVPVKRNVSKSIVSILKNLNLS